VVDFYCAQARLIVEVDGDSHAFRMQNEESRTQYLVQKGYRVLRFTNREVQGSLHEVLESIASLSRSKTLTPALSLIEGEGADYP